MFVEIRAAEGGDDAKMLVDDQFAIYRNLCKIKDLKMDVIERRSGILAFRVQPGDRAWNIFGGEAGGHRWQRVPPNEKRGRVHTSTVTVATLPEVGGHGNPRGNCDPNDLVITVTRGSGPGGQHRNKTETCVSITHRPTGLKVRCDETRSQTQNRELAMMLLDARILEHNQRQASRKRSEMRKSQVGSGMRGDKRRTIRTQDGVVTDHLTGRRWELKRYLRGEW